MQLKLQQLSFSYQDHFILKKINHSFNSGSIHVFSGKNGSGKTTLLKLIATLLTPSYGDILYDDLRFESFKKQKRSLVSYVTHTPMLYPELSLDENISFFMHLYQASEKPNALLKAFQLTPFLDMPIKQFSRGMKQKASLVTSFIKKAELYLFDEPFSGLDQESQLVLKEHILKLSQSEALIFMVSHHMKNMENSQSYHMENGRIEDIT